MSIISFLCALMIVGQDLRGFTDDPSRSQQVQAQVFVSDSLHSRNPLIVIGVASMSERATARNLLESTGGSLQQIEVRAISQGYKVIRDGEVIYLISPSHWRDNMLLGLCHLAEQLSTVWQIRCIIWAESCDDPNAKNPITGTSGLMQIHPCWFRTPRPPRRKQSFHCTDIIKDFDPFDPCDNITCGVYLFCKVHGSDPKKYGTGESRKYKECMNQKPTR